VDERTADEDRPMLGEIRGERGDRDRRRRKRDRKGKRREEREAGPPQAKPQQQPPPPRHAPPPRPAPAPAPAPSAPPVSAEEAPALAVEDESLRPEARGPRPTLADVAFQLLKSLSDPRPVHARQLAAMAAKRKLAAGDPEELWKAFKAALLDDARARQGRGLRPRVRHHGGGLFALAVSRLEPELAASEEALALRAETLATDTRLALRRRLGKLPLGALEQLARVYLERAGWRDVERVKRVDATSYLATRSRRGALPVRVLVGVRAGADDVSRRNVGELRAGVVAKQLDEGLLLCAGRLSGEADREARAPGPPLQVWDGDAFAEELIRAGVGVMRAALPIAYFDADFFAELVEG
jgi:hypothetical protein